MRPAAVRRIDAPTCSSYARARPKVGARRLDERRHCKHELADVRWRQRAKDPHSFNIDGAAERKPCAVISSLQNRACLARRWWCLRSCTAGANDWMERRNVSRAAAW